MKKALYFILKRFLVTAIVLFVVLLVTISILGSTMDKILEDSIRYKINEDLTQQKIKFLNSADLSNYIENQLAVYKNSLGLNEPWYSPIRILNTMYKIVSLDLGQSYSINSESGSSKVIDIIVEKIPRTLILFTTSTIIIIILGMYGGAFIANKVGSIFDKLSYVFTIFGNSFPTWWIGILMLFIFAFLFPIFPTRSTPSTSPTESSYFLDIIYHLLLPIITIIIANLGSLIYIVRHFVINELEEDYIKAKKAMGISTRKIIYSHALKNAAPPILTLSILSLTNSLGGAITVEVVFDWPGIGKLFYDAVQNNESSIVLGLTYIFTLIFILSIFVIDIAYTFFDPRIKVG